MTTHTGATSPPEVDVVILTWNDAADATLAIESVVRSTGVAASVQVVDNASTVQFEPPSVAVPVLLHRSPVNVGVGGGRNLGATLGAAPYLCFLDSDAQLAADCLAHLVEPLRQDPQVALAAPVFVGQPYEIGAGRAPTVFRKIARGLGATELYAAVPHGGTGVWDIQFAIGACQLVRRSAFNEIGGIDDSARFGPEDLDMCRRLSDTGFRLVQVEAARCDHVARRSSRRWLTRRGMAHAVAVARYYLRRAFRSAPTNTCSTTDSLQDR